jgi:biotin-(acetyl-CoA carboxylase) ligase
LGRAVSVRLGADQVISGIYRDIDEGGIVIDQGSDGIRLVGAGDLLNAAN